MMPARLFSVDIFKRFLYDKEEHFYWSDTNDQSNEKTLNGKDSSFLDEAF